MMISLESLEEQLREAEFRGFIRGENSENIQLLKEENKNLKRVIAAIANQFNPIRLHKVNLEIISKDWEIITNEDIQNNDYLIFARERK